MPKHRAITLDDGPSAVLVKLKNGEQEFTYRPALVSRSVQRRIRRAQWEMERLDSSRDLPKRTDDDGDEVLDLAALTPEQLEQLDEAEEKAMRGLCDLISLTLTAEDDDAPPAGDLLFGGWVSDEIAETQIYGFLADLGREQQRDPTPA